MRVKVSKRRKLAVRVALLGAGFMTFGLAGSVLLTSGLFGGYAMAQVTGACANCHTMHNMQNGLSNNIVNAGQGAAWNIGGTQITGGGTTGQQDNLLVSDCLGCHSAAGTTTTISFGGDVYPIVYSLGGYPAGAPGTSTHPLAGGNFASNAGGADIYGHNVYGISNPDSRLTTVAPGNGVNASSCANTCHHSLALDDATTPAFRYDNIETQGSFNGCRGCHNKLGHHKSNDPSYRYLGGHGGPVGPAMDVVCGDTACNGTGTTFEDGDWEQSKGPADHNFYAKQDDPFVKDSVGYFCTGCHGEFHSMGSDTFGPDPIQGISNGGDDNTDGLISKNSGTTPWLRHPTNVNIPFDTLGEYQAMIGNYSPDVPVAQDPTVMGNKDTIGVGDQVMCLSCHRAHASQYPDALRFDYTQMIAHNGTDLNTGCFFCHRAKDV